MFTPFSLCVARAPVLPVLSAFHSPPRWNPLAKFDMWNLPLYKVYEHIYTNSEAIQPGAWQLPLVMILLVMTTTLPPTAQKP